MEIIGIIASLLGIIAFFAVAPKDVAKNFKRWFVVPFSLLKQRKVKLSIQELFAALNVEDIRIENIFTTNPLKSDCFDSEVVDFNGKLHDEIESIKIKEIKEKRVLASKNGMTFDNNASFALRRIDVSRPEGENGKRKNIYKLILEPTDYYSFVFPNLCLDKRYYNEHTQEHHLLRESLSLYKERLSISTLIDHPNTQFKIGTGTLAVTSDRYLICSVRSRNQFVATKQDSNELSIHLSTAEGMYRSVNNKLSSDCFQDGKPSPFITSLRSLKDELNLDEEHLTINDISCFGYFLDLKRSQPFFLFFTKLRMAIDEFFSIYSNTSMDIHENEAIFALPIEFSSIKKLFNNSRMAELEAMYPEAYNDFFQINGTSKIRIASNHAKVGFATFIFREFSPLSVSDFK